MDQQQYADWGLGPQRATRRILRLLVPTKLRVIVG